MRKERFIKIESVGPVTCIVCYTDKAKVLLYPCRHFCLCEACATKIKQEGKGCPVCRVGKEKSFEVVWWVFSCWEIFWCSAGALES